MHHKPFFILLRPFALIYKAIIQLRNTLFDRNIFKTWKAPIPVVSIGNITLGGTGKTPLVDWIVKYYLSIGVKPAIISRGYRRESKGVQLVSDGNSVMLSSREAGDETAMLAWNNPDAVVVVAEKRKDAVTWLLQHFAGRVPSVIILDDAFQHRQIRRDLNIAIINAAEPFFHASIVPEGRLREPLNNLSRADLILLNKITDTAQAEPLLKELEKSGRPIIKARVKTGDLVCFSGECISSDEAPLAENLNAFAFAGIASPESFLESLKQKGVKVVAHQFFHDHEPYTAKKLHAVRRKADQQELCLITTEKDYFRILGNPELISIITPKTCYYLKIETDIIEGKEMLQKMLKGVVGIT
jgi:tetraacyldisaccharide 4'-kinase